MLRRSAVLGAATFTMLALAAPIAQPAAPASRPIVRTAAAPPTSARQASPQTSPTSDRARTPRTRTPRTRIATVGHRGAAAYAPENTLAGVRKAAELGAPWVEYDIQRTRDGRLIAIHDTTLARTTDVEQRFPARRPWRIADFTLPEIRTLDAGSWFAPRFRGERVPTLGALLGELNSTGRNLLLELKDPQRYPGIERDVLAELARNGWLQGRRLQGRLLVQSFDAGAVRTVHRLRPDVRTGYLGTPPIADLPEYAKFTDQVNPPRTAATREYVNAVRRQYGAHGRPLEIYTWTLNEESTTRAAVAAGVDGLITDVPDKVLAWLRH